MLREFGWNNLGNYVGGVGFMHAWCSLQTGRFDGKTLTVAGKLLGYPVATLPSYLKRARSQVPRASDPRTLARLDPYLIIDFGLSAWHSLYESTMLRRIDDTLNTKLPSKSLRCFIGTFRKYAYCTSNANVHNINLWWRGCCCLNTLKAIASFHAQNVTALCPDAQCRHNPGLPPPKKMGREGY